MQQSITNSITRETQLVSQDYYLFQIRKSFGHANKVRYEKLF